MSLVRTLEIDRKLIPAEDEMGLSFAERLWAEDGSPADLAELCRGLEGILTACSREGLRYPAILLRRKKELQRGTWQPSRTGGTRRAPSQAVATADRGPDAPEGVCKLCGGSGSIVNPGGLSARFCECYLRKIQAEYDAKRKRLSDAPIAEAQQ